MPIRSVDLAKVDGLKLRAPAVFNKATENLIINMTSSSPNRGFPDLTLMAWEKIFEENPELVIKSLKATALQKGASVEEVINSLRQYKPDFFNRIEV